MALRGDAFASLWLIASRNHVVRRPGLSQSWSLEALALASGRGCSALTIEQMFLFCSSGSQRLFYFEHYLRTGSGPIRGIVAVLLEHYSEWQIGFLSKKEHFMPPLFGATDTPICPECKNLMRLTRRTPHPKLGYDFELQTFACRVCQHEVVRNADRQGEVTE
jgi:hypothetical protein